MIITAYAKPNGFKWTQKLAAKAPVLDKWRVTALRHPMPIDWVRERIANGPDAELSKMWFQTAGLGSRDRRRITVFVEYIIPGQERAIGRHVLDTLEELIGERGMGEDIALYEVDSLCNASKSKRLYQLEELPAYAGIRGRKLAVDVKGRMISHR